MQENIEYKVTGLFNKMANFECPKCHVPLSTALKDGGKADQCPHCGQKFISPGLEILVKEAEKEAAEADRKKQRLAQNAAREEQRRTQLAALRVTIGEKEHAAARIVNARTNPAQESLSELQQVKEEREKERIKREEILRSRVCANCGRTVGNLEKAHLWNDSAVCFECYERLDRQTEIVLPPEKIGHQLDRKPGGIHVDVGIIMGLLFAIGLTALIYWIGFYKSENERITDALHEKLLKVDAEYSIDNGTLENDLVEAGILAGKLRKANANDKRSKLMQDAQFYFNMANSERENARKWLNIAAGVLDPSRSIEPLLESSRKSSEDSDKDLSEARKAMSDYDHPNQ